MALPTTSNVTRPRALGYGARLGSLYLQLAASPDRQEHIESAPLQPPRIQTEAFPEEFDNEFGKLFARVDFTGGEGLEFAHRRENKPSDLRRFWDSKGIDVHKTDPTDLAGLRLLHETSRIEPSTDTRLALAYDQTALYMAEGTTLRRSTDFLTAVIPTFADESPHAGEAATTIYGLAYEAAFVYAALGTNGIHRRSSGTWAHYGTATSVSDARGVWTAKNFVLAADTTLLKIVPAAPSLPETLVTLSTGRTWRDVRDVGAAILACADDGYIYALSDDGAGSLQLSGQTFIGTDEVPYAVAAWHGSVLFETCQNTDAGGSVGRLYLAELNTTTFTLTNAVLVRQWGMQTTTYDACPRRLYRNRHSVYTGINESSESFLWQYSFDGGGVSRNLRASTGGVVNDIIAVQDKLFFTVSGQGLYREEDSFETDGYLIGPLGDHFTSASKAWAGAFIDVESVTPSQRVELFFTTDPDALLDPDSASWTRVKNVSSSIDLTESPITNVEGRYLAGMVKLYPNSDRSTTPTCRAFGFRSYPGPGDQLIRLVVNISGRITRPGKRRIDVPRLGLAIYDSLKQREGTYQELRLLATDELFRGTVEKVTMPTSEDNHHWPFLIAYVDYRGRRAIGVGSESSGALGVGTLGIMAMGGSAA